MKKIYIVRHAQSTGNADRSIDSEATPLSELGRKQAQAIANRIERIPHDAIIASTMARALETAEAIASRTGKQPEPSALFVERAWLPEHVGSVVDDEHIAAFGKLLEENFENPDFEHGNTETFEAVKVRAGQALDYLAARPEDTLVVVSHTFFTRVLLARALFGEELTAAECKKCMQFFHSENTGITLFTYDPGRKTPWELNIWNDHAHLG